MAKSVCLPWEINASAKLWSIFWSIFWASSFVNPNTWHLIHNNFFITWITWYCMLMCCVYVFSLCRESPDMIWETNSCFLRRVCHSLVSKPLQQFFGLCLKTKVDGLVILASKSPRWFLGLCLKTKWEEVCRFAPQNRWADEDGVRTRVDIWWLAFSWSKLGQGFLVLLQNWQRSNDGWCTWHHHEGHMKVKQKTDGSMASSVA
jgi:hypothetical protein